MTRKDAYRDYKSYPDRGCKLATEYLGRQSHCILLDDEHNIIDQCPFPNCIFDESGGIARSEKKKRNEEIIQRWKKGESIEDLAKAFSVTRRTIERVVQGG